MNQTGESGPWQVSQRPQITKQAEQSLSVGHRHSNCQPIGICWVKSASPGNWLEGKRHELPQSQRIGFSKVVTESQFLYTVLENCLSPGRTESRAHCPQQELCNLCLLRSVERMYQRQLTGTRGEEVVENEDTSLDICPVCDYLKC